MPIWPREPEDEPADHVGADPPRHPVPGRAPRPRQLAAASGVVRDARADTHPAARCARRDRRQRLRRGRMSGDGAAPRTTSACSRKPSLTCSKSAASVAARAGARARPEGRRRRHAPRSQPAVGVRARRGARRVQIRQRAQGAHRIRPRGDRALEARPPDPQAPPAPQLRRRGRPRQDAAPAAVNLIPYDPSPYRA